MVNFINPTVDVPDNLIKICKSAALNYLASGFIINENLTDFFMEMILRNLQVRKVLQN